MSTSIKLWASAFGVACVSLVVPAEFGCGSKSAPPPDSTAEDAGANVDASPDDIDAGPDHGAPSTSYPAPHSAAPSVANLGGEVLANPVIIPITYATDPRGPDLEAFASMIGASNFWSATTKEYGVGAATSGTPIHITDPIPTDSNDTTIQQLLSTNLEGTTPLWGPPNKDAVYTFFFPSTTNLAGPNGESCQNAGFNGYHGELTLSDGTIIAYAVIAGCASDPTSPFPGPTGLDEVTRVASHEWIEAATDPHIAFGPAFVQPDNNDIGWEVVPGGEVADMCAFNPNAGYVPAGFAHAVQRSWSNAAAAAGNDPCVPHVSATPYFNAAPVLNDSVTISYGKTHGVHIPIGTEKTIEVDLFSDGDTGGPWTLSVVEPLTWVKQAPELKMSLDRTSGQNGEKVYLTIKALSKDKNFGGEFFAIVSTLGDQSNIWYGTVGN